MNWNKWVVVWGLAAVTVGAGCKPKVAASDAGAAVAREAVQVEFAKATLEAVPRRVDVTGTLAPWEEALVSIEADGRIVEVKVDLGDRVKKGDVLARVSSENYALRKNQAEAELSAAQADFTRVGALVKQEMAPKQQLDEARRRLSAAQANAGLARKGLSDTSLRSPIDGTISRRLINVGEFVRVGTPALSVVRTSPLKLKLEVPERYIADVQIGDSISATSEALPGTILSGKIVRVGPAVSLDTRAFPVEARFENEEGLVKPGSFARGVIRTERMGQTVTVPEEALATFAGNPRVYVVSDGKVVERTIEVTGRFNKRVLVSKGLQEGEIIATSALEHLAEGVAVTERKADQL